jgi:Signal transduction histidine kinase
VADKKVKNKNDYKVIIAELGVNPFHVVSVIFALMCVIPLLAVFYIVSGKHFFENIFLGLNGIQMLIAILIALTGLFYAYNLVRNLTEKLLVYAEEYRRADCEKEEFMMSVSHDLKVPLETIKMEIGNIRAGAGSIVGGIIEETVKKCLNATDQLTGLIKNIMGFPSFRFIRTNIHRKPVDLIAIVKTELGNLERFAKNNNLTLRSRFITENAKLWGDEDKLSRMAANLIHNAIKFAPKGGVVNVLISSDDDTVQFVIENIVPEVLSKSANMAVEKSVSPDDHAAEEDRADEVSIAKDIVELHGGHLTINNVLGEELEFRIVLPRDLRTRKGMTDRRRDVRDSLAGIENENIDMWIALNKALTDIVSKTKAAKQK